MIFIGGISSAVKQLDYVRTVICGKCGRYGRYRVFMTYTYFSLFFIPVFKWNRRFYVEMSCCGSVYELGYELGMRLLRGEEAEIREEDLTFVRSGTGKADVSLPEMEPAEARVCPSCGREVDEEYSYCPYCGRRL